MWVGGPGSLEVRSEAVSIIRGVLNPNFLPFGFEQKKKFF